MTTLGEIYETVKGLPKKIGNLPGTTVQAMKNAAGDIVGVTAPLAKNVASLKQPFEYSGQLVGYIAAQGASVRGEGDKLRAHLRTYFSGIEDCTDQTNELAKAVGGDLVQIDGNPQFTNDLLDNVLNRIPDVVLLPVSRALDSRPGWESQPAAVARMIETLNSKISSTDPKTQYEVDLLVLEILTCIKVTDKILQLATRLTPRDLNAGLAVVGEGGNLTLTGHPLSWVFVIGSFVLQEVDTIVSAAHQAIKLRRSL